MGRWPAVASLRAAPALIVCAGAKLHALGRREHALRLIRYH